MVRDLWAAYEAAAADSSVHCLLLEGAGGKAFCAGGDVKGVWEAGRSGEPVTKDSVTDAFFREEYALNAAIAGCPKPQVSVWDGIVMGGGVGVSIFGKYRIATEKSMFAMPETNIGLFPDVGGSYFLSRLPGELGTYIGLTGDRLYAADLLHCGLATHFVPSDSLPELTASLSACTSVADVDAIFAKRGASAEASAAAQGSMLEQRRSQIDAAFGFETMEEVMLHLADQPGDDDFSAKTLKTLGRMSPTSMKIALRLLREARRDKSAAPLSAALAREFRVVQRCVTPPADFFEGIRAALVDKDRSPKWQPPTVDGVGAERVEEHFASLGGRELDMPRLPGFAVA